MRRSLILGALAVLVSFEAASAGTLVKEYYDVRRTGGHKRSEADSFVKLPKEVAWRGVTPTSPGLKQEN